MVVVVEVQEYGLVLVCEPTQASAGMSDAQMQWLLEGRGRDWSQSVMYAIPLRIAKDQPLDHRTKGPNALAELLKCGPPALSPPPSLPLPTLQA